MDYNDVPLKPQRQDSLNDQLNDLITVANRLGMYDASSWLQQNRMSNPTVKYGCHCDLEEGEEPDACVIDLGRPQDCVYAEKAQKKERCKEWKPIQVKKMKDYTNKVSEKIRGNWHFAMSLPAKLNADKHLGFDDWYLPDIDELYRMIDRKTGKKAPGAEHLTEELWSSSSFVGNSFGAYRADFNGGRVILDYKNDSSYICCVRP